MDEQATLKLDAVTSDDRRYRTRSLVHKCFRISGGRSWSNWNGPKRVQNQVAPCSVRVGWVRLEKIRLGKG